MKILAINTATKIGGVALLDAGCLLGEYTLSVEAAHSEKLMPAVARVLDDAGVGGEQLDAIAVTVGPGSFTGLRIGVTTAKALAWAWEKPLAPVVTLDALAWQGALGGFSAAPGDHVCPVLDARRGGVYTAMYSLPESNPSRVGEPQALPLDSLAEYLRPCERRVLFLGDGVDAVWETATVALADRAIRLPNSLSGLRPASVAEVGRRLLEAGVQTDPTRLLPLYIRQSEAEARWQSTQGSR